MREKFLCLCRFTQTPLCQWQSSIARLCEGPMMRTQRGPLQTAAEMTSQTPGYGLEETVQFNTTGLLRQEHKGEQSLCLFAVNPKKKTCYFHSWADQ